jgi:FPC/CPF motif-containing protein YcgG
MASPPDLRMSTPAAWTDTDVAAAMLAWVQSDDYPCLGARSAFRTGRAVVGVFDELGSAAAGAALVPALTEYADSMDLDDGFTSYIAAFRGPGVATEADFERLLWTQLQAIHDHDGTAWDASVSADPRDDHFGFSVNGRAYFVIGMHPQASRLARRTPFPMLAFNLHEQFDRLRRTPRFEGLRDAVRRRDERLQGFVNPMVDDYGRSSEALQYSGRRVIEPWVPPFHAETDTTRPHSSGSAGRCPYAGADSSSA